MFKIRNGNGVLFNVRVILTGDAYGLNDCLTLDDAPMVEFYDTTYPDKFGPRGQFVSRYYLDTLLERQSGFGLVLDGGVTDWTIDAWTMQHVESYLQGFCDGAGIDMQADPATTIVGAPTRKTR